MGICRDRKELPHMDPVTAGLEPQKSFFLPVVQKDGQWTKVIIKELVCNICSWLTGAHRSHNFSFSLSVSVTPGGRQLHMWPFTEPLGKRAISTGKISIIVQNTWAKIQERNFPRTHLPLGYANIIDVIVRIFIYSGLTLRAGVIKALNTLKHLS